jgi:hypothetical protein
MIGLNGRIWREGLEDFTPTVAEYPFMSSPPLIRRAADCLSVQHQLSPELYIVVAQAAASLAVQGLAVLKMPDGRSVPLSIYFLVLAMTGLGKSPAWEAFFQSFLIRDQDALEAFKKAEKEYPAKHRSWKRQCDDLTKALSKARQKGEPLDRLQAELTSLIEQEPIAARLQSWLISDTTGAAFLKRLAGVGESTALAGDEGEKLLTNLYQYIADLCQLWSHGRTDSYRVGTGATSVMNARVMTLLLLQAKRFYEFCETAGRKGFGIGVWARFLVIAPKEPKPGFTSTEGLDATSEPLDAFLARIAELINERERRIKAGISTQDVIELDADACNCWKAFDDEMRIRASSRLADRKSAYADRGFEPGDLLDVREFAAKASIHVARLAAVFAYFCGDTKVTLDMVQRAISIVRYHIEAYRHEFSMSKGISRVEADAQRLETYLRTRKIKSGGTTSLLLEFIRSNGPTIDLRRDEYLLPALQRLEARGLVRIHKPSFGGKPYVDFSDLFK